MTLFSRMRRAVRPEHQQPVVLAFATLTRNATRVPTPDPTPWPGHPAVAHPFSHVAMGQATPSLSDTPDTHESVHEPHRHRGIAAHAARPVSPRPGGSWTDPFEEAAEQLDQYARDNALLLGCLLLDTGPRSRLLPGGTAAAVTAAAHTLGPDTAIHVHAGLSRVRVTVLLADTHDALTRRLGSVPTVVAVATHVPAGARLLAGRDARGSTLHLRARTAIDVSGRLHWLQLIAEAGNH